MTRFARFFEALHRSRHLEADRLVRRYRHLIDQAHAHKRRCEIEAVKNPKTDAEPVFARAFIAG